MHRDPLYIADPRIEITRTRPENHADPLGTGPDRAPCCDPFVTDLDTT